MILGIRHLFLLPFFLAIVSCKSRNVNTVVQTIDTRANLRSYKGNIDKYDSTGFTLLMHICLSGQRPGLAEECLKRKANILLPAAASKSGFTAGFTACHYITFPSLSESKLPGGSDRKTEAQMIALLELFHRYRPEFDSLIDEYAFISLLKYNNFCATEKVFVWLKPKINLYKTDTAGNTLLHTALLFQKYDAACFLAASGLSPDTKNKIGEDAWAVIERNCKGNECESYKSALKQSALLKQYRRCE
ncbi:MAG: hypothetical protein MUC87_11320 [Bacteroidia bacterium]|jgi:hypothetical protein|nr:hypothetical protein [Bacteroidia bacterium]